MTGLQKIACLLASFHLLAVAVGDTYLPPLRDSDKPNVPADGDYAFVEYRGIYITELGRISCKYRYQDEGWSDSNALPQQPLIECGNRCQGKVHFAHEHCDDSCDAKCTDIHRLSMKPVLFSGEDVSGATEGARNKMGIISPQDWHIDTDIFEGIKASLSEYLKRPMKGFAAHWVTEPCWIGYRRFGYRKLAIICEWELYRYDTAPGGRKIKVTGDSGETVVAYLHWPELRTPRTTYVGEERCRCQVIFNDSDNQITPMTPPPATDDEEDGDNPRDTKPPAGSAGIFEEQTGQVFSDSDLKVANVSVQVPNMNQYVFSGINPSHMQVTYSLGAGTLLEPEDSRYQRMLATTTSRFDLASTKFQTNVPTRLLWCTVGSSGMMLLQEAERGEATGRALCLEMNKKEPHAGVRYRVSNKVDESLQRLARYVENSRFRGPWDQVRTWIYTDMATLEEIQKKLDPAPGAGMYLRSAYEVAMITGAPFDKGPHAKCLQPDLLLGTTVSEDGTEWAVSILADRDPKRLALWAKSNSRKFSKVLQDNPDEYDIAHVGNVVHGMCMQEEPELQIAGMDLLLQAVPEKLREQYSEHEVLPCIANKLRSGDPKVVQKALDVVEAFKYGGAVTAVLDLKKYASDPEMSKRAEEVLLAISKSLSE